MSVTATLAAGAVSVAALGWLAMTDPKRRRAFGLPPYPGPRQVRAAWLVALLPGAFLPFASGGAGFVLWLGGVGVVAWALIALPPGKGGALTTTVERWRLMAAGWSSRVVRGARVRLAAARTRMPVQRSGRIDVDARITALELRIRLLEAEIARFGHAVPANLSHGESLEIPTTAEEIALSVPRVRQA